MKTKVADEVGVVAQGGAELLPGTTEEFPIPVVSAEEVEKADRAAEVIDKHLDFESRLQGRELRPSTLCPEQKVSLVSDLTGV